MNYSYKIGIIIQKIIWAILISIFYFEEYQNISLLICLVILVYFYFDQLLYKSEILKILHLKYNYISIEELLYLIDKTKFYCKVSYKSFHYDGINEIVTYKDDKFYVFNHKNSKKYELNLTNKNLVLELSLSKLVDNSTMEQLEGVISENLNSIYQKDIYCQVDVKYGLVGFDELNLILIYESFFMNKWVLIFSYFFFIGEFIKLYIESILEKQKLFVEKQIEDLNNNYSQFILVDYDPSKIELSIIFEETKKDINNSKLNEKENNKILNYCMTGTDENLTIGYNTQQTIKNVNYHNFNFKKLDVLYIKESNIVNNEHQQNSNGVISDDQNSIGADYRYSLINEFTSSIHSKTHLKESIKCGMKNTNEKIRYSNKFFNLNDLTQPINSKNLKPNYNEDNEIEEDSISSEKNYDNEIVIKYSNTTKYINKPKILNLHKSPFCTSNTTNNTLNSVQDKIAKTDNFDKNFDEDEENLID